MGTIIWREVRRHALTLVLVAAMLVIAGIVASEQKPQPPMRVTPAIRLIHNGPDGRLLGTAATARN